MYMGVIPDVVGKRFSFACAPHVYGGDPYLPKVGAEWFKCSPCIWG